MAAPSFVALGAGVNGIAAVSPPWPASGNLVDDIALLFVETANEVVTLSTPAGFVLVTLQGTGTAAGLASTRLTIFWARATSTTPPTPTIADPGDHVAARIATFRGCINTGDPWDVFAGDVLASPSTTVTIPGATTTVIDTRVVLSVANATDIGTAETSVPTNAALTGITEHHDTNVTAGNGGGFDIVSATKATAGAYGTSAATLVTSSVQARITIALKGPQFVPGVKPTVVPQAIMRSAVR